jgi:hypothetical protein
MKRLNQGHIHPKLEVTGLTCPGWESNQGLCVVNSYSEHLHMNWRPVENACNSTIGSWTKEINYRDYSNQKKILNSRSG